MKIFYVMIAVLVFEMTAFAHGEDKPGPHGGYIEMSKNIHTEVNPDKDGSFHIFLLDGNFENPTVKDSSLKVSIKPAKKGKSLEFGCEVMGGTHFHCKPKSKAPLPKDGQLVLHAVRDGVQAGEITYELSKLKVLESKKEDHSSHH